MDLRCEKCGEQLVEQDFDREKGTRMCPACGDIQELRVALAEPFAPNAEIAPVALGSADVKPFVARPKIAQPMGMYVRERAGGLTFNWSRPDFARAIGAFVGVAVSMLMAVEEVPAAIHAPAVGSILSLLFSLVLGASFAAIGLAALRGRLSVDLSGATLVVASSWAPWMSPLRIEKSDIAQLFCAPVGSGRIALMARTKAGRDLPLIGALHDPRQALFIEQSLERALGISDARVEGEVDRDDGRAAASGARVRS